MLFLEPFFKKAALGTPLNANEIKEAFEAHINKKVPKSTIYRMLSRNGWKRKVGKTQFESSKEISKTNMHDYWIEGCAQVLHPERTGNISQQWRGSGSAQQSAGAGRCTEANYVDSVCHWRRHLETRVVCY